LNCTDDVCRRFTYCQNKEAIGVCPCSECVTNPLCNNRCSDYFNYCLGGEYFVIKDNYGKLKFEVKEVDSRFIYSNIVKKEDLCSK
jgi:hypothetical protein